MNEYDSAKLMDVLGQSHGVMPVDKPEAADLLVLNTCSIREKAQEKVFSELGRWKERKKQGALIAVGGCVASQEGEVLQKRAPIVDVVFGPQTLHRLPQLIENARTKQGPVVDVSFPEIEKFDCLPAPRAEGPSALVSIMEGCSKYCSFCVVPYTRGEEVSRPFDQVLEEVALLAAQGVREINFLGQNVNAYRGALNDGGGAHDGEFADLGLLLRYAAALDNIGRLRFTTSHPLHFGEDLFSAYAEVPELASFLHLPVQSGSDRVLARMKRGYTALEYRQKIRRLRRIRPGISISSDLIVGFPGESEEDHQSTLRLIEEVGFDASFSFIYSPRPGTPAAAMADGTPPEVKKRRLHEVQELIDRQARALSESMVGSVQSLLVTGKAKRGEGLLSGRSENNRVVHFAGSTELVGSFVGVRIDEALPHSLNGSLVSDRVEISATV